MRCFCSCYLYPYRNYTAQDVETLKKISVYRKLGISIKDIQSLLETGDKSILLRIYQEKVQEKVLKDSELEALKQFIDDGDADKANEALDYQTVENAIESLLPGKEWGDYFKSHFKPFLNVRLKTLEQKQALQNILEYCDETTLKVPFIMGIGAKMIGGIAQETRTVDEMIAYYRDMSESEYERLKEKALTGAKMKNGIMKYHPAFVAQRKMQKELQNKGYNDIFIPNLMVLSPQYVCVRNPYNPKQVTKYSLSPEVVDLIAFCTKNPLPMLPLLDELKPYGQYWFVTITPYGKDIEPNVPDKETVMEGFKALTDVVGVDSMG